LDETQRISRRNVPDDLIAVEVELPLQSLMFGVEMFRFMFAKVHSNHDAEEERDDRHVREYTVVTTLQTSYADVGSGHQRSNAALCKGCRGVSKVRIP
jgi:hypothetical protein